MKNGLPFLDGKQLHDSSLQGNKKAGNIYKTKKSVTTQDGIIFENDEGALRSRIVSIPQNREVLDSVSVFESEADKDEAFYESSKDTLNSFLANIPVKNRSKADIVKRATNLARNVKSFSNITMRQERSEHNRINKYKIQVHNKITLSLACFVLFLIGAPLGAIIRKGGLGMPMVMAILFFVVFHILSTMGKKFAEELVLTPFQGMWLSIFVLLPLGMFLTYKAANDSALFNMDAYWGIFKKIWRKNKKEKA